MYYFHVSCLKRIKSVTGYIKNRDLVTSLTVPVAPSLPCTGPAQTALQRIIDLRNFAHTPEINPIWTVGLHPISAHICTGACQ